MQFLINLLISSFAVFVSARIIPGVTIDNFSTSVVVAIVIGIVNAIIKPILLVLTLPINVVTLGIFTFVVNAAMILLVDNLVGGFSVDGFFTALIFSIVLSLITTFLFSILWR